MSSHLATDDDPDDVTVRRTGVFCRLPGCDWSVEMIDRGERATELLAEHVRAHPPRVLAENLVSVWLTGGMRPVEIRRDVAPVLSLLTDRPADEAPKRIVRKQNATHRSPRGGKSMTHYVLMALAEDGKTHARKTLYAQVSAQCPGRSRACFDMALTSLVKRGLILRVASGEYRIGAPR